MNETRRLEDLIPRGAEVDEVAFRSTELDVEKAALSADSFRIPSDAWLARGRHQTQIHSPLKLQTTARTGSYTYSAHTDPSSSICRQEHYFHFYISSLASNHVIHSDRLTVFDSTIDKD